MAYTTSCESVYIIIVRESAPGRRGTHTTLLWVVVQTLTKNVLYVAYEHPCKQKTWTVGPSVGGDQRDLMAFNARVAFLGETTMTMSLCPQDVFNTGLLLCIQLSLALRLSRTLAGTRVD